MTHTVEDINELRGLMDTGRARKIREAAGLSRAALAVDLEVDALTIARWEGGVSTPRRGNALRYLRLLRRIERQARGSEGRAE